MQFGDSSRREKMNVVGILFVHSHYIIVNGNYLREYYHRVFQNASKRRSDMQRNHDSEIGYDSTFGFS